MWSFTSPPWATIFKWATIGAAAFGGIGVLAAFVSAWVGYQITDATQREANEQIANARADAARAMERTALLEKEAQTARERAALLERATETVRSEAAEANARAAEANAKAEAE